MGEEENEKDKKVPEVGNADNGGNNNADNGGNNNDGNGTNDSGLASRLEQIEQKKQQAIDNVTKKYDAAIGASTELKGLVDGWITEADNEAKARANEEAKAEKNAGRSQLYGGIAEAAAAITNLIGTTQGAVSQQWKSPQQEWAQRIEKQRLERERKSESVRNQLKSLEAQRAQLEYKIKSDDVAKTEAIQKIESDAAQLADKEVSQLANIAAKTRKDVADTALKLALPEIKSLIDNGETITEGKMQEIVSRHMRSAAMIHGISTEQESLFKGL